MTRQNQSPALAAGQKTAQAVALSPLSSPLFRIGAGIAIGAVTYVLVMAPLAVAFAHIAA